MSIAATYIFLVLTQPADITNGLASGSTLVALGGFLLGAMLLIVGVLPTLPTSTLVLMPVALVLNVVLGQIMGSHRAAVLLRCDRHRAHRRPGRPRRGRRNGRTQQHRLVLHQPHRPALRRRGRAHRVPGGAGCPHGLFRRFYLAPVAGFVTGILAGVVSAPIAAFVFGGTSGAGTGAMSVPSGPWATRSSLRSPSRR